MIDQFVKVARSYVGTPFHWHGRIPGAGLDCSGVIVCAGREVGLEFPCPKKYTRTGHIEVMEECLSARCVKVAMPAHGDILVLDYPGGPGHLMILDGHQVIHASDDPRFMSVLTQPFDRSIQERVVAIYRIREGR